MTTEEIRSLRNSEPFQAFTMVLQNGRRLRVDFKSGISLSPSGKVVSVDVGSAFAFVDLSQIAEIELRQIPGRHLRS